MKFKCIVCLMAVLLFGGCFTACNGTSGKQPDPTPTLTPTPTAIPEPERNNYLFVYFVGDFEGQESIFFAVSEDGYNWKDLNNGRAVMKSELGTTGLRDPFIIRSAEEDKYYMIATDLCIAKSKDWWQAQINGSTAIMVWETQDLVNWTEQRMEEVNFKTAGCTWAPEAYYDEETGEYIVFWASRTSGDHFGKQRIFYSTTKDFTEFSKPKVWIDYPYDVIDATIIEEDGVFYRFLKYEGKSTVILERADSLMGEWTKVESATLEAQLGVEGPTCFEFHEEDIVDGQRFALLLDNFGGGGYYIMTTDSLADGEFQKVVGYSLPSRRPRHGTVIAITQEEYDSLIETYGTR